MENKSSASEILSAAAFLFSTKGYKQTSMTDIATRCSVYIGDLLYYFSDKEEIALAVMARAQAYCDRYIFIHAYDETAEPIERLIRMHNAIETYVTNRNDAFVFLRLIIELMGYTTVLTKSIRYYFSSMSDAYSAILRYAYESHAAQSLANDCVCALQGALIMTRATGTTTPLLRLSTRLRPTPMDFGADNSTTWRGTVN
jgi:AcrR family transcriptional regulator